MKKRKITANGEESNFNGKLLRSLEWFCSRRNKSVINGPCWTMPKKTSKYIRGRTWERRRGGECKRTCSLLTWVLRALFLTAIRRLVSSVLSLCWINDTKSLYIMCTELSRASVLQQLRRTSRIIMWFGHLILLSFNTFLFQFNCNNYNTLIWMHFSKLFVSIFIDACNQMWTRNIFIVQ